MRKHQVLIVGAGISGSSTAYHMAKAGIDVLMVEKEQFPRDKPCGDGVIPSIHPLLKSMGVYEECEKFGYKCKGTYVSDPREHEATFMYDDDTFAFCIQRYHFDDIINRAARRTGIDYLENFEATDLLTERGQVVGVRGIHNGKIVELNADLTVLANGSHSMLARDMGFYEEDPSYLYYGIRGYFDGVRGLSDTIEFHYADEFFMPGGYVWVFPMGGQKANVGVFITEGSLEKTGKTMEEILWWWRDNKQLGKERLGNAQVIGKIKGWRLPTFKRQPVHNAGVIAVGDAGNMIEPLYGGGIPYALMAGVSATNTAKEAIEAGDFSEVFLRRYEEEITKAIGVDHTVTDTMRTHVFSNGKDIGDFIDFTNAEKKKAPLSHRVATARFLQEQRGLSGNVFGKYTK